MTVTMKANRIHVFGGPEVILFEDVPRPTPGAGEVLVRVHAAGVGPWDAWVRAGRSAVPQPLPLTLGADLAGAVEATGDAANGAPGLERSQCIIWKSVSLSHIRTPKRRKTCRSNYSNEDIELLTPHP
jgi:D-arabinose 1-dehydrogenase-like Zn-dependent alcohol dehydrogenase